MPLAWRGLAACQVGRLAAAVCVCFACGGGRTAAPEPACGQPQGEREREMGHAKELSTATVSLIRVQGEVQVETFRAGS